MLQLDAALRAAQRLGRPSLEATLLAEIGALFETRGHFGQAVEKYEQALSKVSIEERPDFHIQVLEALGSVLVALEKARQAVEIYSKALGIVQAQNDKVAEIKLLENIGLAYSTIDVSESINHYVRALDIARRIQDLLKVAELLMQLGQKYRQKGDLDQAQACWIESAEIHHQLGSPLASNVNLLLSELNLARTGVLSSVELSHSFFQSAGFTIQFGHDSQTFLINPSIAVWQRKFTRPIFVKIFVGQAMDADATVEIRRIAENALGCKPEAIFVIVDRPLADTAWLQIATMRVDGIAVIPLDDATLLAGQEGGRQIAALEDYMQRFWAMDEDLYDFAHPVTDRLNFFGRETLAQELIKHLTDGHSLALFGLRKIGKSSLLYYLRDKFPFPTAIVDLQAGVDLANLYERILESWSGSIRSRFKSVNWAPAKMSSKSNPSIVFATEATNLLSVLEKNNITARLCLLIDEAELIFPDPSVMSREEVIKYLTFARTLRGLAQEQRGKFSFLIAGVDPRMVRQNRLSGQQNPFYKFFRELYLPALHREDCIQMVRNIGCVMGLSYSEDTLEFIADISGGHPFIARQLCSLAYQRKKHADEITLEHIIETASRFIREPGKSDLLDEHGLWGEISDSQLWPQPQIVENQAVLTTLADTEPLPEASLLAMAQDGRAREQSLDEMSRRAILGHPAESFYNIQFQLFRQWIRRYKLGKG